MKRLFLSAILILVTMACLGFAELSGGKKQLKVVVTTTHLGCIVREIGGARLDVVSLIPGGACPGHFDIEPATAKKIADADIFISHHWEKRFDGILKGIDNAGLIRKYTITKGSWMVPSVNALAVAEVTEMLCDVDAVGSTVYKANLATYQKQLHQSMLEISERVKPYRGVRVLCSDQQEEFLRWLGFTIAGTYGRPDDMNIKETATLMAKAKNAGVRLIIDNLQSGANAGTSMAKDLKIPHVTLTNFPEGNTYLQSLNDNVQRIVDALKLLDK
jgi:zinc transport system substrate-binding protein